MVIRRRHRVLVAGILAGCLLTTGWLGGRQLDTSHASGSPTASSPQVPAIVTSAAVAPPRLSVAGNAFRIDGTPTRLVGQSLIVVLTPAGLTSGGKRIHYPRSVADAKALYRDAGSPRAFFEQVRGWAEGTNVVRLQVSQFGLAPRRVAGDPVCDRPCRKAYLKRVSRAVTGAKEAGLVVILSMQYQRLAGGGHRHRWRLPSKTTNQAWRRLATKYADDRGVAFELYNEPQGKPTTQRWAAWRTTHQHLLTVVRDKAGATRNVVIVDGLAFAQRWDGYRDGWLKDPRLAFAMHAYPNRSQDTPAEWRPRWNPVIRPDGARLMAVYPTAITEWSADSAARYCTTDDDDGVATPDAAADLLRWLRDVQPGVGIFGWSFDISTRQGFTVDDDLTPGTLEGFTCGGRGWGPGRLFQDWAAGRLDAPDERRAG